MVSYLVRGDAEERGGVLRERELRPSGINKPRAKPRPLVEWKHGVAAWQHDARKTIWYQLFIENPLPDDPSAAQRHRAFRKYFRVPYSRFLSILAAASVAWVAPLVWLHAGHLAVPEELFASAAAELDRAGSEWPAAVPKVVHQTYRSEIEVPQRWRGARRRWEATNPSLEYRFWSDAEIRALVEQSYPELRAYVGSLAGVQLSDVGRYLVLHKHGGVYADMDYRPERDIAPLLAAMRWGGEGGNPTVLVARSPHIGLTNALVAAVPGSAPLERVVGGLREKAEAFERCVGWPPWWPPYAVVMFGTGSHFWWDMMTRHARERPDDIAHVSVAAQAKCMLCAASCPQVAGRAFTHDEGNSWHKVDTVFVNEVLLCRAYMMLHLFTTVSLWPVWLAARRALAPPAAVQLTWLGCHVVSFAALSCTRAVHIVPALAFWGALGTVVAKWPRAPLLLMPVAVPALVANVLVWHYNGGLAYWGRPDGVYSP